MAFVYSRCVQSAHSLTGTHVSSTLLCGLFTHTHTSVGFLLFYFVFCVVTGYTRGPAGKGKRATNVGMWPKVFALVVPLRDHAEFV